MGEVVLRAIEGIQRFIERNAGVLQPCEQVDCAGGVRSAGAAAAVTNVVCCIAKHIDLPVDKR
ncbi:hypothetical protein SDC9_120400 [bioreactor metagenome]|uniref:Uncharacterized protein n=1 Tax=bioreactor metagenome TaxID=1076179 RepID=A0A645C6P3_9ZZZZ